MTSLTRILCAIDLERASERAFERAVILAHISDAKLYLLHATPANVRFSSRSRERLEYLTDLKARAEAAGVRTRVDEQHGDPAAIIILHANARKMDLGTADVTTDQTDATPNLLHDHTAKEERQIREAASRSSASRRD
jgi:hypothetical protein